MARKSRNIRPNAVLRLGRGHCALVQNQPREGLINSYMRDRALWAQG